MFGEVEFDLRLHHTIGFPNMINTLDKDLSEHAFNDSLVKTLFPKTFLKIVE